MTQEPPFEFFPVAPGILKCVRQRTMPAKAREMPRAREARHLGSDLDEDDFGQSPLE